MKKPLRRKFTILVLSGTFVLTIAIGGVYSSWLSPLVDNIYTKMKVLTAVMQTLQRVYVEDVNTDHLINDAIRGMLKNLDPHTNYMTAEEVKQWSQRYEGYSGIGISYAIISEKITIMSVIEGGPSQKLGFQAGDRIIEINSESAIGIKEDEVRQKLMGPSGTMVSVAIEREGWEEPKEFSIVREEIHLKSVPNALFLEDGLGYIRLQRFSSTTAEELEDALAELESQNLERLILDLRDNSGGYLQMAVEVAEKFLPQGKMIVYTKGRIPQAYREYRSSSNTKHRMAPLIVLVNQSSASASEIVAGAIQDWDRGLILGTTSFGKGLVQTQYQFADGSVLMVTTARYYTPSGRLIQRDYDGKSLENYYREVYVDSLREANFADLPKFKTFAGREVYGGGGIAPDHWLESKHQSATEFVIKLARFDSDRYLYSFSEEVLRNHPEINAMTPRDFSKAFTISDSEITDFGNFVLQQGYDAPIEDFVNNSEDLKFLLMREIAFRLWKDEGSFYINLMRDTVLLEAVTYFEDASQLLGMSTLVQRN
ncbi:MAG: S41 family peptidase [bacterium]